MTALSTTPPGGAVGGGRRVPGGRRQADRRAATRTALLAATVSSLVERGYAGTTTAEVQARAGLSRGALTHHFSSKAELLVAAVGHLYKGMSAQVVTAAADLPTGPARLRPALALLWSTYDGPLFTAAMELWAAARTDGELRAALLPHERRLGAELRQLCGVVLDESPADLGNRQDDGVFEVLLTSMRGTAMARWLGTDVPSAETLDAWEAVLRRRAVRTGADGTVGLMGTDGATGRARP